MAGAQLKEQRWLFVGIARYTWHYHRLTEAEFQTIDSDPKQIRFARKGFHTVGSALELDRFYSPDSFDVVMVNGVVGHGTDDIASFQTLLTKIRCVVKKGGVVLLGYNEPFKEKFFDISSEITSSDLFERFIPPIDGLQDHSILIDDSFQHRYVFLRAR
jgi:ubiquinone/menaquinone biosynthesis C-methylase UbiE